MSFFLEVIVLFHFLLFTSSPCFFHFSFLWHCSLLPLLLFLFFTFYLLPLFLLLFSFVHFISRLSFYLPSLSFALSPPLRLLSKPCGDSSRTRRSSPPPEATPGRWWSSWVCAVCRSVWGCRPWTAAPAGSRWLRLCRHSRQKARNGRSPARSGTSQIGQNSQRGQRWSAGCAPWRSWCCPQSSVQEGSPACVGTGSEAEDDQDSQSLDQSRWRRKNQTAEYEFITFIFWCVIWNVWNWLNATINYFKVFSLEGELPFCYTSLKKLKKNEKLTSPWPFQLRYQEVFHPAGISFAVGHKGVKGQQWFCAICVSVLSSSFPGATLGL